MSPLQTIWLVTRRELVERGAKKGYLVGTLVTLVIVAGLVVVPTLFGDDGPEPHALGVVGDAPADFDALLAAGLPDDAEVTVTTVPDRDEAVRAVGDGELDAVLVERTELLADGRPDQSLQFAVEAALQLAAVGEGLEAAGLDPAQAASVLRPTTPLETVDVAGEATDGVDGFGIALAATILLFVGIQGNGATLLSGAIEEKSSRVVEVLLSVARPWHLLAGKLLAMSVLALVQLGLTVAAALGANAVVGAFELPPATGGVVAISLLMLVVGFLFYASLYAVAGSMASSLEDAQSTSGPLTFAVIGAYFAAIFVVLPNPDGLVTQILTFVPPTAPFVVPARMAFGAIPMWQVALATLVTLATTVLVVRLAGRLYAGTLLAGNRMTWREAWKAEPVR
ncbi:ABC transporter permease [Egicoccus halophilus]|uniref:ABC transporter permease n=1 Tax=Egicoccus halophilus TaxID=1670830 RepID=A0A8J3ACN0_9ACTN|nr:ABC transporter permease [Egicoccus halophilus]GGI03857.1 ABC transporter permease [Egicoccus halophilus]